MSNENKSFPWGKVIKLFLEFLLAVVTAIFASSCVSYARNGTFQGAGVCKVLPFLQGNGYGCAIPCKTGASSQDCGFPPSSYFCVSFCSMGTQARPFRRLNAHFRPCRGYCLHKRCSAYGYRFRRASMRYEWYRHRKELYPFGRQKCS